MDNNESVSSYSIEFPAFMWMEICELVGLELQDVTSIEPNITSLVVVETLTAEVRSRIEQLQSYGTPVAYTKVVSEQTAQIINFKQAI